MAVYGAQSRRHTARPGRLGSQAGAADESVIVKGGRLRGERLCRASAERSSLQAIGEARGHCPLHNHVLHNTTRPADVPAPVRRGRDSDQRAIVAEVVGSGIPLRSRPQTRARSPGLDEPEDGDDVQAARALDAAVVTSEWRESLDRKPPYAGGQPVAPADMTRVYGLASQSVYQDRKPGLTGAKPPHSGSICQISPACAPFRMSRV